MVYTFKNMKATIIKRTNPIWTLPFCYTVMWKKLYQNDSLNLLIKCTISSTVIDMFSKFFFKKCEIMRSDFCFFVVDYTAYMWDGICMRQTGVVIMCGNDAFHGSGQNGCRREGEREREREEGVRSRRRGPGCAPHLPMDCRSARVSAERRLPWQLGIACFRVIPRCTLVKTRWTLNIYQERWRKPRGPALFQGSSL